MISKFSTGNSEPTFRFGHNSPAPPVTCKYSVVNLIGPGVLLLEMIVKRLRLCPGRIEDELREVQHYFPAINAMLNCRRDDFTDTVRQNMLTAYEFLDAVMDDDFDLFSDEGLEALLKLNHFVLLGKGYDPRSVAHHSDPTAVLR